MQEKAVSCVQSVVAWVQSSFLYTEYCKVFIMSLYRVLSAENCGSLKEVNAFLPPATLIRKY